MPANTWDKFGRRFFMFAGASFGTAGAFYYFVKTIRDQVPRDTLTGARQIQIYNERKAIQEQFERDLKEQMKEVDEKNQIRREVFEAQQKLHEKQRAESSS